MSRASAAAATASARATPPVEVVLPAAYYGVLALEVIGLLWLHHQRPEESGGERYGYLLGWAGVASMSLMHVYSLRRRVKALRQLGRLRTWLHFHIFMGLQGALFVTYHSLHLHSPVSIQGINIACVGIVVASGLFGRYLYAFIPKSLAGERLTAAQIEAELAALGSAVADAPTPELAAAAAAVERDRLPLTGRVSLGKLIGEDLRARRALRQLTRALASDGSVALAAFHDVLRRRVMLSRRLATFAAADRLFRGWTILHKPLTYVLAAATLLHIFAHYIFASGMSG